MNNIEWLQNWYKLNCNGEWEQLYGIEIGTLDNPGWSVKIDLNETKYYYLDEKNLKEDKGDNDWIRCSISDGIFNGYGDCMKLEMIVQTFRDWICE